MAARVELKIFFDTISEYNEFCAGNGIQVEIPAGMSVDTDAEPTLVEYDPVADGSVEAEPAPAPAAPAAEPETLAEASADDAPATLDDAMAAGDRLVKACGNKLTEAQAILKAMGVARVSALESSDQFAEFIRRCDEAVAAKGAGSLL